LQGNLERPKKERKKEKSGIEKWSSVDRKPRNAADPGRLLRRRRFQTSKPLLLSLAFSTYLTQIASRCPVLASIQIVNLRASSTRVNNKNQPGTQSSTRQGNAGAGFDLTPPMLSFLKRGRKDAMNIPSSNRASDHQEKGWRVINTPINTPYTVLQAYINSALISF
jgi:hypothetical protein